MRKKTFNEWLKGKHPEVRLVVWQQIVADMFSKLAGDGSGKSFLIQLLSEWESGHINFNSADKEN